MIQQEELLSVQEVLLSLTGLSNRLYVITIIISA